MTDYRSWNTGLLTYVTAGVARGRPVYLHVDTTVLATVGRTLPSPVDPDQAEDAFCEAVRSMVCQGGVVHPWTVRGHDPENEAPLCVAFLGATVLAATRMRDGEVISDGNYFTPLREVLGFPQGHGRPPGLDAGWSAEEPLWLLWNRWLQAHGWLPTAARGLGSHSYIHYPISQALLRGTDGDRLRRIFSQRRWGHDWHPHALVAALAEEPLSVHLRDILSRDGDSREAVCEAIHELYESWRVAWGAGSRDSGRTLRCGLLRGVAPDSGHASYHFYPKTTRQLQGTVLIAETEDGDVELSVERPGWYEAFGTVLPAHLERGTRIPVRGGEPGTVLACPARRFWLLVPDPDDPESGVFADWGVPAVGDPFLLLVRREIVPELRELRHEGFLRWRAEEAWTEGWLELQGCEVISASWSGVFLPDRELQEALVPRTLLGLRLTGGLRAPGGNGWMHGAGPCVEVSGFATEVELTVVAAEREETLLAETIRTGTKQEIAWPRAGDYRIEISTPEGRARRVVNLVQWEQLRRDVPARPYGTVLPGAVVMGAQVVPSVEGS